MVALENFVHRLDSNKLQNQDKDRADETDRVNVCSCESINIIIYTSVEVILRYFRFTKEQKFNDIVLKVQTAVALPFQDNILRLRVISMRTCMWRHGHDVTLHFVGFIYKHRLCGHFVAT